MADDQQRRGWLLIARNDVTMREAIKQVPVAFMDVTALDVLDALVEIIDRMEAYRG